MSGKIIAGILVVVLVGVGAWAWFALGGEELPDENGETEVTEQTEETAPQETGEAEENGAETNQVAYTQAGFEPQTITVSVGTTVTWENQSDNAMWVASDPHPSHTDLPGLDTLENIESGEEYSFTFEEAGEWGYHDHLNPARTGTVIVE